MSEEKKIWRVEPMVRTVELEEILNQFANEGYQIHSLHPNAHLYPGKDYFMVVAFDPTQIMKKQSEDVQAQMNALMNAMASGAPTPK